MSVAPNYMVFVCSLNRAAKLARKSRRADLCEGVKAATDLALLHYRAKDYDRAVSAHAEAWRVAGLASQKVSAA